MTLGEKQRIFSRNIALLILFAYAKGYEITLGNTTAPTDLKTSVHPLRLAIDLNLFRDGKYLTKTDDHIELGVFWKSLHEDNRWGGDFSKPDGNHYSMTIWGRA